MLRFAALLLVCAGSFAVPAAAQADDLIQLNGDPPVALGGHHNFGLLYLDGTVRLARDTSIMATDVFIGPNASVQACWDLASAGNNCTNGRSLSITASGGVAISPAIDLRGVVGTNRAGGSLIIRAGARLARRRRRHDRERSLPRAASSSSPPGSSSRRRCARPARASPCAAARAS